MLMMVRLLAFIVESCAYVSAAVRHGLYVTQVAWQHTR
jgi:hypothetical protein